MLRARRNTDELDAGPRKRPPGAERLCAVTREVKPVDDLIRFVVGPDGVVSRPQAQAARPRRLDHGRRARRSTTRSRARCLRAASSATSGSTAELADLTERLLERAALDALVDRRQGRAWLLTGFAKVEAALAHDDGRGA